MRKEGVALLLVLVILASGTVGYLAGASSSRTTTLTTLVAAPHAEQVVLAASCSPLGYTGQINATNVGSASVNLTEIILVEFGGSSVVTHFPHGFVIASGNESTLTQGFSYMGGNVTIGALSAKGSLFYTSCSHH